MGDLRAVEALATELARRHDRIDVLIHNAGALTADRRESPQGIEMTVASQVMGPFLLTARLLPQLRVGGPGRVLTMSSGGMYSAASTVERLQMGADYKGAEQYARAKRAQVTLNEMWAQRVDPAEVVFHALHPGWADTPGVAESLPTFRKVVGPLLRSPRAGRRHARVARLRRRGDRLDGRVLAGPPRAVDPPSCRRPGVPTPLSAGSDSGRSAPAAAGSTDRSCRRRRRDAEARPLRAQRTSLALTEPGRVMIWRNRLSGSPKSSQPPVLGLFRLESK